MQLQPDWSSGGSQVGCCTQWAQTVLAAQALATLEGVEAGRLCCGEGALPGLTPVRRSKKKGMVLMTKISTSIFRQPLKA